MNMLKCSAKNTQKFTRFAVALATSVGLGHMGYQIEAKGISDSKPRLYMP